MATVLYLPDDIAALLERRASECGLTVAEFISEMALHPMDRQVEDKGALEDFIGRADVTVDEPFDIHQARAELADELLRDHDEMSASYAQRSSHADAQSTDFG